MPWIESHSDLEDHPKTLQLMGLMGLDLDVCLGKLHRFWWWAQKYAEDGDLRKYNDAQLGHSVGLNGDEAVRFVKAMVTACWLDREPYFRIHDWWDRIGPWLRSRYKKTPEKWELVRNCYVTVPVTVTTTVHQPNQPNQPNQHTDRVSFSTPTLDEVQGYCLERGNYVDPQAWWDYYKARGWKFKGGQAMKDWKAAVRTWEKNQNGNNNGRMAGAATPKPRNKKYEHLIIRGGEEPQGKTGDDGQNEVELPSS